jgi:hypothetical protein
MSCGFRHAGGAILADRNALPDTLEGLNSEPLLADMPGTGYLRLAAQVRSMDNR